MRSKIVNLGRKAIRPFRIRDTSRLFWWRGPPKNAGDLIGPYIFEKLTDSEPVFAEPSNRDFRTVVLSVGSLGRWFRDNTIVWGSGVISGSMTVSPPYEVLAVRGPLTKKRLNDCGIHSPSVYGDPALLLPLIYSPSEQVRHRLGIVAHYVDIEAVRSKFDAEPGCRVIDMRQEVEPVIEEIASCEMIVSTSLHGLILAHAYGRAAAWAELPPSKLAGDGTKFLDYYAAGGVDEEVEPLLINSGTSVQSIEDFVSAAPTVELSTLRKPLLAACPYPLSDTWKDHLGKR